MVKRLLSATPKELLAMGKEELMAAIRMSEGRTIMVASRVRCPNMVDGVTNAELAAAFGADIVVLDTYDPKNPYIPGLDSVNPADDQVTADVQIKMGRGRTAREIRELVGRPVGVLLAISDGDEPALKRHYGNIIATPEIAELAVEQGADLLCLTGWVSRARLVEAIREIKKVVGDRAILEYGREHGPGLMNLGGAGTSELITQDEIAAVLDAGVDVIGLPAPGTFPGWGIEHVSRLASYIHSRGALLNLGLHTSQEGADADTVKQIALWAKMAGADIFEIGDSGYTECMVPPENIMAVSIAIRGRRHTFRRMAFSPLR
ncbi:MAG TPA: haloacid dehalogenase-like hydrolase [Firmicutes bacterium]|nr:haloacid dehalogenase-like hydrolase [Candidatus Fermentithermobacillaceae bacterium]